MNVQANGETVADLMDWKIERYSPRTLPAPDAPVQAFTSTRDAVWILRLSAL